MFNIDKAQCPQVKVTGKNVSYFKPGVKPVLKKEITWACDSIRSCTCCQSITIVYSGDTVFQAGLIPEDSKPGRPVNGTICRGVMKSGKANFLANLVLYPGALLPLRSVPMIHPNKKKRLQQLPLQAQHLDCANKQLPMLHSSAQAQLL